MTKPKVLISDKMDPNAAAIFRERGCEVDEITGLNPEELKKIIGKYDGLAIRSSTKVTKEILAAAKNLKVIGRAGIGVDNVDIPAASAQGVVVMNTPFGNSITTAEHAIALMFALARQIPEANAQTQAGNAHYLKLTNLTFLKIGQRLPKYGTASPASFDGSTIPTLAKIASLEGLELFEVRLTAKDLEPLKDLPKLKKLVIHTADISEADVAKVKAMLPNATVTFTPLTDKDRDETLPKKLKI